MKKYLINIGLGIILTGCSVSDMNTDDNSAYTATPGSLLTYSQKKLVDYLNDPNVNLNNFRLVMQYWQETTYLDESQYNFVSRNVTDRVWQYNFRDVLINLKKAKDLINEYEAKGSANEKQTWERIKKNQLAIIDLLECFVFGDMVDTFGDIPYNKVDIEKTPKYSKAADIYSDLIKRVKADIANLDTSVPSFSEGENLYHGDVSKWRKFGNSLLLKLGVTLSDVNPNLAQQTVKEAISQGVMSSSEDGCLLSYEFLAPNFSPLYANLVASGRNDYVGGKTIIDNMNQSKDPRISAYFQPLKSGEYVGGVIGMKSDFKSHSSPGKFAYTPTTKGNLLTYTEVAFYLAEAAARWWPATAAAAYNTAVKISFKEWGVKAEDANSYLSRKPYDAGNWKKSIGEQAWLAMYNQANVGWNFWKRLDYPVLSAAKDAVSQAKGKVPVRLQYPVQEVSTNPSNYKEAAVSIGGDELTTKIFWDKY